MVVGSLLGGVATHGAGAAVVVSMGVLVGGTLLRVCRRCTRGAVRVMCVAVGLEEVGACVCSPFELACSPFDAGHGSVAGSYVGGFVGGAPVNFRMASVVV